MKIWQEGNKWYAKCDYAMTFMPYANQKRTYGPRIFKTQPQIVYSWADEAEDIRGSRVETYTLFRAGRKEFMIYQRFHKSAWRREDKPTLSEERFIKPVKPTKIPEYGPAYSVSGGDLTPIQNPATIVRHDNIISLAARLLGDWQERFDRFIKKNDE